MNNYQNSQIEINHLLPQNLNLNSSSGGIIPYGFEIKRSQNESSLENNSCLEQLSNEIKIVKMIHSLFHSALSCKSYNCQSITEELNEFGVQRRGIKWSVRLVESILSNRIYFDSNIFLLRRKNSQDEIFIVKNLPIIPAHVFQANQAKLDDKLNTICSPSLSPYKDITKTSKLKLLKKTKKLTSSKVTNNEVNISRDKALLCEIAICGSCRNKLTLIKTESGFKYVCSKQNIKDYGFCKFNPIEQVNLETKVVTFLRRTAFKRGFANVSNQQVIDKIGQITKNNICNIVIKSKKDSTVRIKLVPTK